MKTQQEYQLYYWGPHYNMVKEYNAKHGCDVKPWECVKWNGTHIGDDHPIFDGTLEYYTFSLTILYDDKRKEHRPVFVGDKIYGAITGGEYLSRDIHPNCWEFMSWNPPTPKRTFKLNDNELNCPINDVNGCRLDFLGVDYYFKSMSDINKVASVINNILCAARDKE